MDSLVGTVDLLSWIHDGAEGWNIRYYHQTAKIRALYLYCRKYRQNSIFCLKKHFRAKVLQQKHVNATFWWQKALKSNNLRDLAPLESWSIQCANTGCASFIYLPHSLTFQLHPSVTTSAACSTSGDIKGVQEKLWFFTIHCNPSLTYIAVRDLQGSLNAMRVYSHSYWLVLFCTTNSSQVLARERWQTFENSWKKTQFLMNTLYVALLTNLGE